MMEANTFVEQICEFNQEYSLLENLIEQSPKAILLHTQLEDEGMKDWNVANHYGTFEYIVFCNN